MKFSKELTEEFNMTSSSGDTISTIKQIASYKSVHTYIDLLITVIQKDSYSLKITTTQN